MEERLPLEQTFDGKDLQLWILVAKPFRHPAHGHGQSLP